eukprot:scaffold157851_cov33-Tisochrysis_lutea.AAC.8
MENAAMVIPTRGAAASTSNPLPRHQEPPSRALRPPTPPARALSRMVSIGARRVTPPAAEMDPARKCRAALRRGELLGAHVQHAPHAHSAHACSERR